MPIREHNTQTLSEHMLLAFIATFIAVLLKNRLNILYTRYVEMPASLNSYNDCYDVEVVYNKNNKILYRTRNNFKYT